MKWHRNFYSKRPTFMLELVGYSNAISTTSGQETTGRSSVFQTFRREQKIGNSAILN